ncbi:hypothetical protein ACFQZI_17755 [Mucilaginibacter lutimaris]|uniref:Kazal-like domain-containing protein n=1 Tax=Mucilaginibacter lutimaris TaxID=931629 RepID=A0ABW2ZKT4_9SPHI
MKYPFSYLFECPFDDTCFRLDRNNYFPSCICGPVDVAIRAGS